jgi:transposase
MVTIGCDVHLRTTTMTVLDHGGTKIARKRLENDPDQLLRFVRQFHGEKRLAMETCYNWPVFYELFKNEVGDFRLLHARKLQSIVKSQAKNDTNDADEIAYLVYSGRPLTESYVADIHTRGFRRLLRTRVGFSLDIARIKNQIHAVLNAHTFYSQRPKTFKDLFCKRGLAYLKAVDLPEQERFILDRSLDKIAELERRRDEFDEYIQRISFHHEDLKWLQSVPGMRGEILKYIILAEIDNVHRFRHARGIVAYAGLIPRDKSSGEKQRYGGLRSECNQFLRWALLQAVIHAIRQDAGMKTYYKEVKKNNRNNSSAARIATARALLKAIYWVLKEQRPYREHVVNRAQLTPPLYRPVVETRME